MSDDPCPGSEMLLEPLWCLESLKQCTGVIVMCLMSSQLTPRFPVPAVSIKIFTKISIMRVRSVEGNCYFLIKRVGTYYGNETPSPDKYTVSDIKLVKHTL